MARDACLQAVVNEERGIWVAYDGSQVAGFIIANRVTDECPEIDWLIVPPEFQGRGVAQKLMEAALDWIGKDTEVKLGVIRYNRRAIAFYEKYGFKDTVRLAGKHKIPRILMKRSGSSASES